MIPDTSIKSTDETFFVSIHNNYIHIHMQYNNTIHNYNNYIHISYIIQAIKIVIFILTYCVTDELSGETILCLVIPKLTPK